MSEKIDEPLTTIFLLLVSLLVKNSTVVSSLSSLKRQMYCSFVDLMVLPTSRISKYYGVKDLVDLDASIYYY